MQNSILYVFGGQASSSSQSSTFPLFASLNLTAYLDNTSDSSELPTWQALPSADAVPVLNPQCVLTDTHLLIVGGQPLDHAKINPFATNTSMTYCGLQAYSFAEQGWQSLMPAAGSNSETVFINLNRTGHAASWMTNVGNGQPGLFVMGGIHYNATLPANDAFILSPFTIPSLGGQPVIGAASIPNNLPPPTVNSGSAVVNGGTSVIFFGGTELPSQQQPTSIWEYSPSIDTWKTLSVSLPNGMPNANTGWIRPGNELVVVDLSEANTGSEVAMIPLTNAGLRRRQQSPSAPAPEKMDGSSVAFDPIRNLAIVSGGNGVDQNTLNIFNTTSDSWSVLSVNNVNSITPSATGSSATISLSSTTSTASLQSTSGSVAQPQSSGFNKANLLAPIILGGVVGLLGLLGLSLLLISYYHRRVRKRKQGRTQSGVTPAGLWLKYGNRKQEDPISQALGGEIFLRNLEEKHGLRRDKSAGGRDRRKTGWSKYFSASWYNSSNNQRGSVSTANTARALVNETRDHAGPYGAGWDAASRVSKASTFLSVASEDTKPVSVEGERFSGSRWSYYKKIRTSNASSGVLGSTLGDTGSIGAGGVRRL